MSIQTLYRDNLVTTSMEFVVDTSNLNTKLLVELYSTDSNSK